MAKTVRTATEESVTTLAKVRPSTLIGTDQGIQFIDRTALADDLTFDQAVALAADEFGGIVDATDEIGDGFEVFNGEDKRKLVGLPMVFLEWTFRDGDQGRFATVTAVARNDDGSARKIIINDGSHGIMEQLAKYTLDSGRVGGMIVKRGLRESEYEYEPGKRASTFYIA